jgi:hypothetical protein
LNRVAWIFIEKSWVLNLILLALIGYVAASGVGAISIGPEAETTAQVTSHDKNEAKAVLHDHVADHSAIIGRDLFGVSGVVDEPSLDLLGTVFTRDNHPDNQATIYDWKTRQSGVYKVGDKVGDASVLKSIGIDRIILVHPDGSDTNLEVTAMDRNDVWPGNGFSSARLVKKAQGVQDGDTEGYEWEYYIDVFVDKDLAIEAARDFLDMFKSGGYFPKPMRVYRLQPESLWEIIGLRRGDIINGINGELTYGESPMWFAGLWRIVRENPNSFPIEIERDGSLYHLNCILK